MSAPTDDCEIGPGTVDHAAARVLRAIDEGCEPGVGLRDQVEEALSAVLRLLATEPSMVRALTSRWVSREALERRGVLRAACAERLRTAAERATGTNEQPPFVESFLIAGVQFQISSARGTGELERLAESVPNLRDWILVFYSQD